MDFVDLLQLIEVLAQFFIVCWRDVAIGLLKHSDCSYPLLVAKNIQTAISEAIESLSGMEIPSPNQFQQVPFKLAFHETIPRLGAA